MAAASAIPIPNSNGVPRSIPSSATGKTDDALFKALTSRKQPAKIDLSKEETEFLVEHVIREFQDADAASRQYKENIVTCVENWRGTTDEKDFPFEGASNFRVPLTSVYVEQMKARLLKAIFGDDLWSTMEYVDKQVEADKLAEGNQWWNWELREIVKIKHAMRDVLHDLLVTGISTPIPSYHHETAFLHSFKEWHFDADQPLGTLIEAGIQEILEEPSSLGVPIKYEVKKQTALGIFQLEAIQKEHRQDGGKIVFSLDADKMRLRADIWKCEVTFDGARVNYVSLEDLVCPNTDPEVNNLAFFGVRGWYSTAQYRQGLRDGFFIDHGDEENKRIITASDVKQGEFIGRQITDLQDAEEGTDSTDSVSNAVSHKFIEYYRWEGWWSAKEPDSSQGLTYDDVLEPARQIVAWVSPRSKALLKIERLEDLNKDGKRSPVKFGFIHEPGRFFDMGLAEWVHHSQTILDAISNMRGDAQLLSNVPYGFYKPTAGLKGAIRIEPGVFHPSADPSAVNMPHSNYNFAWSIQEEMFARSQADMQAGFSPTSLGHAPSKRQSATEVATTASALDLRTEDILERLLEQFRELLTRTLGLYQQYGPEERMFRVGGEQGVQQTKMFARDRLQGRIQLVVTGSLNLINEQLIRQTSLDMLSILMNEILIQSGIVDSQTMYAAVKLIAKYHNYQNVPLHQPQTPPMSDAPEVEEHQMFAGQKPIGPMMGENTAEHLQHHAMTMADKNIEWTPEGMKLFTEHMQATLQMQQAQQIMKQQQAAMAVQMRQSMEKQGINPSGTGGQNPGDSTGPGTQQENVGGAGPGGGASLAQPSPAQS